MGLQSSHFAMFYYKTVSFYYNAALGLIKYVVLKVKKDQKMPIIKLGGPRKFCHLK